MVFSVVIFLQIAMCNGIWIGEEYWTTISNDGSLYGGRTVHDFLTFRAVHHNIPLDSAYIAFWITYDEHGYYETFGHAYLSGNRVCGRFVDRDNKAKTICGGFRVLSRSDLGGTLGFKFVQLAKANIHNAVEYRSKQVAKIISWQKNEAWYGSACMREYFAEGVDYENKHVKVSYSDDPFFYQHYVYILESCSRDDPDAGKPASFYYAFYYTPKEEHERTFRDQQLRYQQQQLQYEKNEKSKQQEHEQREFEFYPETERYPVDDEPNEKWKFYRRLRRASPTVSSSSL